MTTESKPLRVGIVGTSWWADSMYCQPSLLIPAPAWSALCGRTAATAEALADEWDVPWFSVDSDDFLDPERLDAVVVATARQPRRADDDGTRPGTPRAVRKAARPDVAAADRYGPRAAETGAITLVPFTYRYMPTNQFVKRLIDTGYVGRPFHLNMRYFTGYARDHEYNWRFDQELAGSGVLGDLGSHWLHVARWLLGEITHIGCVSDSFYQRGPRPDGSPYEQNEDSAQMTVRFANGAHGSLQVCAASWEGTEFNQTHHLDLHGADGTIYAVNDWSTVQQVRGVRAGDAGPARCSRFRMTSGVAPGAAASMTRTVMSFVPVGPWLATGSMPCLRVLQQRRTWPRGHAFNICSNSQRKVPPPTVDCSMPGPDTRGAVPHLRAVLLVVAFILVAGCAVSDGDDRKGRP